MTIRKHIPNTITSLNLLCGSLGVVATSMGFLEQAFILMLMGAVFDFCDGLAARSLGAYSPMGKELDSLADQVSFGLLPAFMLYKVCQGCSCCDGFCALSLVPILLSVFTGLRLAKFNIDERQTSSFIGLPSPASAMVAASAACCVYSQPGSSISVFIGNPIVLSIMALILSGLLVCEIPMFSMKFHKGDKIGAPRMAFGICAVVCLVLVAGLGLHWSLIFTFLFTLYIIINIAAAILKK